MPTLPEARTDVAGAADGDPARRACIMPAPFWSAGCLLSSRVLQSKAHQVKKVPLHLRLYCTSMNIPCMFEDTGVRCRVGNVGIPGCSMALLQLCLACHMLQRLAVRNINGFDVPMHQRACSSLSAPDMPGNHRGGRHCQWLRSMFAHSVPSCCLWNAQRCRDITTHLEVDRDGQRLAALSLGQVAAVLARRVLLQLLLRHEDNEFAVQARLVVAQVVLVPEMVCASASGSQVMNRSTDLYPCWNGVNPYTASTEQEGCLLQRHHAPASGKGLLQGIRVTRKRFVCRRQSFRRDCCELTHHVPV